MNRRDLVSAVIAVMVTAAAPGITSAQALADAPVVKASKIIDALEEKTDKNVVLDSSGRPRPPRDPSINLQVQFGFNSSQLLPQGRAQLDELALALNNKALALLGFELAGHTDRVGTAEYNVRLSGDRAVAVKQYLTGVHRISAERLQTVGFGYARLADPAHPASAINRRVEVRRIAVVVPEGGRIVPTPK